MASLWDLMASLCDRCCDLMSSMRDSVILVNSKMASSQVKVAPPGAAEACECTEVASRGHVVWVCCLGLDGLFFARFSWLFFVMLGKLASV